MMRALRREQERGQALVEFSLAIVIFLVLMMAIVDLGRGIYMFNGVSQAAREIARVASVHPGTTFGGPEITAVVSTQKGLIPNLGNPTFACVDIDGGPGLHPKFGELPERRASDRLDRRPVPARHPADGTAGHVEYAIDSQRANAMKGLTMMRRTASRTRADDGQIIVIFALGLVAMIAMVGLVLDGGSTFAQRRGQQNAADLAALAGANDFLISGSEDSATAVARSVAGQNGYPHDPASGRTVAVNFLSNDTRVEVDVSAPHRNSFTGVVGMIRMAGLDDRAGRGRHPRHRPGRTVPVQQGCLQRPRRRAVARVQRPG